MQWCRPIMQKDLLNLFIVEDRDSKVAKSLAHGYIEIECLKIQLKWGLEK